MNKIFAVTDGKENIPVSTAFEVSLGAAIVKLN